MTHNDNQRPFCKLVCKCVWHIRPWKGLVILLLGTIVQCSFVNYFTGSNLSIFKLGKAWISIISFLYPFQPGLFMNFFSFGLAIVYSDIGHWLYWGILKVHKKGSILTFFFSIHNSIVCIVVFNWRSILSHLLTKLIAEVIEWNNCFIRKKGADWLFKCMYTTKKQHILI